MEASSLVRERLGQIAAAFTRGNVSVEAAADLLEDAPFSRSRHEPDLARLTWRPAEGGAWAVTDAEGHVLGVLTPPLAEDEAWTARSP